eukprot:COSAG01_NODE_10349_length_2187_cov_4.830709_3_plen_80_part_00
MIMRPQRSHHARACVRACVRAYVPRRVPAPPMTLHKFQRQFGNRLKKAGDLKKHFTTFDEDENGVRIRLLGATRSQAAC